MPVIERNELAHSVAFRVTEHEWLILQARAREQNTTVPKLAKKILFESANIERLGKTRSDYGQRIHSKRA